MSKEYDPSKNPELVHHYVSHALTTARLSVEIKNWERINTARAKLVSKLDNLYSDGSMPHFKLSRKCIDYLSQNGEWNSSKKIEKFAKWYSETEEETIGKNPIEEFLAQMKNSS